MKKILVLGLLMLVLGGGILLFGPDGIVTDCPLLAGGSDLLASPCSEAMDSQQSSETATRGWAELMTAGGALLAGLAAVIGVVRR